MPKLLWTCERLGSCFMSFSFVLVYTSLILFCCFSKYVGIRSSIWKWTFQNIFLNNFNCVFLYQIINHVKNKVHALTRHGQLHSYAWIEWRYECQISGDKLYSVISNARKMKDWTLTTTHGIYRCSSVT